MNHYKYQRFPEFKKPDRKWPDRMIEKAPIWCSVDLRDGNQALETPMNIEQKLFFFDYLAKIGFKQIEIGFPSASDSEYNFTRALIEKKLIPDDVAVQVLFQSREHIIKRTLEALDGVNKAILHLYNSTSPIQREAVFGKSRAEIIDLAVFGAEMTLEQAKKFGRERFIFEYSPESFSCTEMDFALEICNAVLDVWQPDSKNKAIINLPNTTEMSTPNVHADQIEFICENIKYRESVIISVHSHNDRGTGVAATELALMAGAERVEGTLYGNGERTGNTDIINVAMNMFMHGIDHGLDFSDIDRVAEVYEKCTDMRVSERHPYAGSLVYTAFSGGHQDAINKAMTRMKGKHYWEVPYLVIDPRDVGRDYDAIVRFNSQSGSGGAMFILEHYFGIMPPKKMKHDFGSYAIKESDNKQRELSRDEIYELFKRVYVVEQPIALINYKEETNGNGAESKITAELSVNGEIKNVTGEGNGLIEAFCNALRGGLGTEFDVVDYYEHSMGSDVKSRAITYTEIRRNDKTVFGIGISSSTSKSALKAVIAALNRSMQ